MKKFFKNIGTSIKSFFVKEWDDNKDAIKAKAEAEAKKLADKAVSAAKEKIKGKLK